LHLGRKDVTYRFPARQVKNVAGPIGGNRQCCAYNQVGESRIASPNIQSPRLDVNEVHGLGIVYAAIFKQDAPLSLLWHAFAPPEPKTFSRRPIKRLPAYFTIPVRFLEASLIEEFYSVLPLMPRHIHRFDPAALTDIGVRHLAQLLPPSTTKTSKSIIYLPQPLDFSVEMYSTAHATCENKRPD